MKNERDINRLYIGSINNCLNSKEKMYKFFAVLFFALLLIEFIAIVYFNFFQMEYHMGFDAAPIMLKAKMIWQQKTIFPVNFEGQGNLQFDAPIFLSALIYGITGNVLLGFSISNVISALIVLILIWSISKDFGLSKPSALVIGCLALCPYVNPYYNTSNPLDYFPITFFSAGIQSGRVIYILLVLKIIALFEKKEKNKTVFYLLAALSIVIAFIYGISMGYALALYIVAPIILYLITKTFIKKDLQELFSSKLIYAIILFICIVAGKYIASNVLGYSSKESSMQLIRLDKFWGNVGNTFLGLAKLLSCGDAFYSTSVFSLAGISYLLRIGLFIVYCSGIIYSVRCIFISVRSNAGNDLSVESRIGYYILCFCFVNFAVFFFIDSTYGAPIFEERYLVLFYVVSLFLIGKAIDTFDISLIRSIVILLLSVLILGVSCSSYYFMNKGKTSTSKDLSFVLSKYGEKVVYAYCLPGENLGIVVRNLRVLDEDHIYKHLENGSLYHWGDYTFADDAGDEQGGTVLIVNSTEFEKLPDIYRNNYEFSETFKEYSIYTSKRNVLDFETGLDEDGYSVDLPNTPGVINNCTVNESGFFRSDGNEGYALYGPYAKTNAGTYEFTLHYRVLKGEDVAGSFDVSINNGTKMLGLCDILAEEESCSLTVSFDSDEDTFEYRVYNYPNSQIEIDYIEMKKIE